MLGLSPDQIMGLEAALQVKAWSITSLGAEVREQERFLLLKGRLSRMAKKADRPLLKETAYLTPR